MANFPKAERIANARRWMRHVAAWQNSGLSQAQYCKNHYLDSSGFSYWIKKSGRRSECLQLVPVDFTPKRAEKDETSESSGLVIILGNGSRIEVSKSFDSYTFGKVWKIVSQL